MASMGNILENPHIGMTFIDFFEHTIRFTRKWESKNY